ncbi:hypothetical protein RJ45_05550, partial [Photobacterium gaetbulicola]
LDTLLTYAGFQDRCFQPLSHLSVSAAYNKLLKAKCKPQKQPTAQNTIKKQHFYEDITKELVSLAG